MGRLSDSAKSRDQYRTDADEEGSRKGISSEGFAEDESCKDRIKYQSGLSPPKSTSSCGPPGKRVTNCLECRENRERERGDLNGAPHDIGYHKHAHTQLPSPALVGRAAHIVRVLLIFEEVRLALEREPDGL